MTARLVIVRHGNTFAPADIPRRIGAPTDLPLVESGHEQARRLGAWFMQAGWRFDRILSSPLLRTRQTAEAIRSAQPIPPAIELSKLLAEIDHGPDENRSEAEVVARLGAAALTAWDEHAIAPPGWIVNGPCRLDGWRRLLRTRATGTALLVTSNGASRFALLADEALLSEAARLPSLKLRTGAFGVIEISRAGPHIVTWDQRP